MKKKLLFVLLFFNTYYLQAQVINFSAGNNDKQKTPSCILGAVTPKNTIGGLTTNPHPSKSDDIYTLPIVFHNLYGSGGTPMFTDMAEEYIRNLNDLFSRSGSRYLQAYLAGKIPEAIDELSADTRIQFCLAHTDKSGNATSGIVNKFTGFGGPVYFSPFSDKIFDDKLGGSTLWPKDKYINIYMVENLSNLDAAGYYVDAKAIVMDKDMITSDDYQGYIAHEMGHYLSLPHPWGGINDKDLNKDCNKDDGVDDTPVQSGPSHSHTDYPDIKNSGGYAVPLPSCNNEAKGGNQYINIMDYTEYKMIFTTGQKNKMRDYINAKLPGLKNNGKCNTGACVSDEYDKKADNGDFDKATEIKPNDLLKNGPIFSKGYYYGLLCENDVDVYKFKAIAGKRFHISVRHLYEGYSKKNIASELYKLKIEVFKKTGDEYKLVTPYDKNDYKAHFAIEQVQKGDEEYYIKVQGLTAKDFHPYVPYQVRVQFADGILETTTGDCYKFDGDNSPAQATIIGQPTEIESDICSQKDEDFYKVYLAGDDNGENMSNKLTITLDELHSDLDMTLYNGDGQKINGQPSPKKGTQKEVIDLNLPKGWYYIEIKAKPGLENGYYKLIVDYKISFTQGVEAELLCKDSKYEPNEELDEAVSIAIVPSSSKESTFLVQDYICPSNDNDMYSFTIDQTSDVTIFLYGKEFGNELPANYSLFLNLNGEILSYSQKPDLEWEKIIAKDLKPGKYVIQVFGAFTWTYNNKEPYYLDLHITPKPGKQTPSNLPFSSNIYPNPAKDKLSITVTDKAMTTAALTITNLYGRVMANQKVAFLNGNLTTPISVANYPFGIYTVTIKSDRQVYTMRLSKE